MDLKVEEIDMNIMDLRVLTVNAYDEEGNASRLTIAPNNVNYLVAPIKDVEIKGMRLKRASVWFSTGDMIEINISDMDLTCLEQCVGGYQL